MDTSFNFCSLRLSFRQASSYGWGLFATEDKDKGDNVSMTVMGAYEVYTVDEMIAAIDEDGDPRYPVLEPDALNALLNDDQVVKEGSKLWLRPTRESFMFYVNSSFPRQEAANIERESSKLHKQPPSSADEEN